MRYLRYKFEIYNFKKKSKILITLNDIKLPVVIIILFSKFFLFPLYN